MNLIVLRHCYYIDSRLISKNAFMVTVIIAHIDWFNKPMHFVRT